MPLGSLLRTQTKLLLGSLREGREVRQYIDRFGSDQDGCFAVIKVGGAVVEKDIAALGQRLALLQLLGLKPVLVYGSGPQLDKKLSAAGFEAERHNGLRITPAEAMPIIAQGAADIGIALSEAIRKFGGHAVPTPPGTLSTEPIDTNVYGSVGKVTGVDAASLNALVGTGVIPLIGCAHMASNGQFLNINADEVARSVALALEPQKIIFLTGTGGLLDAEGQLISSVNLATDWPALEKAPWLEGGMRVKIEEIARLLEKLPLHSSVSITNVKQLLRELFTHGGAGTLLRMGERIVIERETDEAAMTELLQRAFARSLEPHFWDNLGPHIVIRTERMRAAAILREQGDFAILDKFAVLPDARGEGLAKAVWAKIREQSETVIWRSRADNPFNAFYHQVADGWRRSDYWHLFWSGQNSEAAFHACQELAEQPADFGEML